MGEHISTPQFARVPVVVIVGFSEEFVDCMREVASDHAVHVKECDLPSLATVAAQVRPFAIFLPHYLAEFDHPAFLSLARDVGADLIEPSDEDMPEDRIDMLLQSALREADERAHRSRTR